MPKVPARFVLLLLSMLVTGAAALAQTPPQQQPSVVAGRVMDGERPAQGVTVALMQMTSPRRDGPQLRAKTGADGRYRIENVPPGRYQVTPLAPTHVVRDLESFAPGKTLNVAAGETVEDVDFRVERGGVITGRVTDAEGNPVVNEQVRVSFADAEQQRQGFPLSFLSRPGDNMTDDRGVYRIYGIPAGRYRVSVGQGENSGGRVGVRRFYRQTFHPDTTESEQARVVEVTSGGEEKDVDIRVATPEGTRRASGRVVDAETGRPVPDVTVTYGLMPRNMQRVLPMAGGFNTNARGEFVLDSVSPGRYAVFVRQRELSDWYSDTVTFEVSDSDVTGIEIKLKRGASVSGVAVVEGVADRATVARMLGQMMIFGNVARRGAPESLSWNPPTPVAPDGSFRLRGLGPGRLVINAAMREGQPLKLSRIELNGAPVRDGIEVAEGAQLTGVRLVFVYGRSIIRGQINVAGGALPPDARLIVTARRVGASPEARADYNAQVDTRGHFAIEGVAAGEYEVTARAVGRNIRRPPTAKQIVSVGDGGEVSVTLVLDLSTPPPAGATQ